ncbi:hypothetical protein Tco_0486115, partial [Tanacetum coccineum]
MPELWLLSPRPLVLFRRVSWLATAADTLASINCSTAAAVIRAAAAAASAVAAAE